MSDRASTSAICLSRPAFLVMVLVMAWAVPGGGLPVWALLALTAAVVSAIAWDLGTQLRRARAPQDGAASQDGTCRGSRTCG